MMPARLTIASVGVTPAKTPEHTDDTAHVPERLCSDQITRIAGSVTFARAGQIRDLLLWISKRSLDRASARPSESDVAREVLNRTDFDPRTDALVRKEMGRLREKLSRYYLSEGLRDSILVSANSGYLLKFERRHPAAGGACWLVLPFRSSNEAEEVGNELLDEVLLKLQECGVAELVSPATALSYRDRKGDPRQFASECGATFVVEGSLRQREKVLEALVWLVDGVSGRAQRSGKISAPDAVSLAVETVTWLMQV